MKRFLGFLWNNRFTVLLLPVLVVAAGAWVYPRLPKSLFPDVAFPKVSVLVHTDDLPVRFMLLEVTRPLEDAAKGVPGVRLIRSQTGVGLTKLHIYFGRGVRPELAYLMLEARLANVTLPPGAVMSVRLMTPNIYPLTEYALVSNRTGSSGLMPFFAFVIRPALLGLRGVYEVNGTGRGWPEIDVDLRERRLAQDHLSAADVTRFLREEQGPFFSGILNAFHDQFVLSTAPRPTTARALTKLEIPLPAVSPGSTRLPLTLGDIARVRLRPPPLVREAAVGGWRHALIITVSADRGANDVRVARRVARRLAALRDHLPPGVRLVRLYDLSHLIRSSLGDVWIALLLGSLIAWLVVLAFLGRWDAALATLLVVPLSVAGTFLVLDALGFGINIMTLGGITAATGALVDHAIVVMERGLHGRGEAGGPRGRRRALARVGEILPLMTMATLTSCVVFLPLLALSGTIGLLFRDMALAVVVALVTSQAVALGITPILTLWMAGRPRRVHRLPGERALEKLHGLLLRRGMRKPAVALALAGALAAATPLVLSALPTAFLPHWDEGIFVVPFRTPTGSSVRETARVGRELLAVALHEPDVAQASLVVGRGIGNRYSTPNKGALVVVLRHGHRRSTRAVMTTLRHAFRAAAPDLTTLETMQIMVNRLGNLAGSHAPLDVRLFGESSSVLHADARRLYVALAASHEFRSLVLKSPSAGPELRIRPRPRAFLEGFTAPSIATSLESEFWGRRAGFLTHGEEILPIRVRVAGHGRVIPGDLARIPLRLPDGRYTSLGSAARVRTVSAVPYITRQNLAPYALIKLSPRPGEGLRRAAARVRALVAAQRFPPRVTAVVGGYYREQKKSFGQMTAILGGALLLLLVLLGLQFGNLRAALAALTATALSGCGAFLALLLAGIDLDSTAFLGVLLVFAIGVNNVILIFARARRHDGIPPSPARVVRAARERLRPVLMTMLADILGFLPLAVGIGHGTDLLEPVAVAVMGGLGLSALMSLWLAPVLYGVLAHNIRPA